MEKKIQNRNIVIILMLMLIGGILRIASCYWGYPFQFHPDEWVIVENAIDLIRRHSWEANIYNRPDHFEIKCCAGLFQLVSYIKYNVSADVAFAEHSIVFYLVARAFTSLFGVLMIPLGYRILEKCKKGSGIIGAFIIAFLPIFVENSAYATPDIVLTFLVMLVAYISILYIEKPTAHKLIAMSAVTGLGITVKYTCAICCIYIALVVIYDCINRRKVKQIFIYGIIAVITVLCVCFFMAPNLFTNIEKTIETLKIESRSSHLGADGLGFVGNFFFYLETYVNNARYIMVLFMILGIVNIIRTKNKNYICLILGMLFWICTSVLALHWDRWGMPMYAFLIILSAIGISYALDWIKGLANDGRYKISQRLIRIAVIFVICLLGVDVFLSGVCKTMYKTATDTRIQALNYCNNNGITPVNSIADGYSPFLMHKPLKIPICLDENNNVVLGEGQEDILYFILSSSMYERYYAEPERFSGQVKEYDAIRTQCEFLVEFAPKQFESNGWLIGNIINNVKYILNYDENVANGPTIMIYKISN